MMFPKQFTPASIWLLLFLVGSSSSYEKDGKCYNSLNLVIALDASGSIDIESWQSGINLSKQIIQSLAIAGSGNKFAVIEFSENANVTHPLNADYTAAVRVLDDMKSQVKGGHTYIDAALNETIKIFESFSGTQAGMLNAVVTVSDGYMTYRNGEDIFDTLKTPVDKLKALKVQMFSASIGVVIKDRTLKFISTESGNRHVFKSEYASALIEKLKNIVETDCLEIACTKVKVSRAGSGCYRDNEVPPRPLPYLTFTDRDRWSSVYSGVPLDWEKWSSYIEGLVCRCAEAVAQQGRKIFGLQFYGECWSSTENTTYNKDGVVASADQCISYGGLPCNTTAKYCVGTKSSNFVYNIIG